MTLEELTAAKSKVVGIKETKKAVEQEEAAIVYIARDADERVTRPLREACEKKGYDTVYVDSMIELGRACNIKVGASSAAIIKE